MSVFSERLTLARKKAGFTQQDVVDRFQITRSAYSAWETGRNEPPFEVLFQLCKILKVSADYLIGLTDSTEAPKEIPVSVPSSTVPRDPFGDLTPDQRTAIETTLRAFREHNAAKAKEA